MQDSQKKDKKFLAIVVCAGIFGAALGSPVSHFFDCANLEQFNIRVPLDNLRETVGIEAICRANVSTFATAGLSINPQNINELRPQSLTPEGNNVKVTVTKSHRDLQMESGGWKLDVNKSLCNEKIISTIIGNYRTIDYDSCFQYVYVYSNHNLVTNGGINLTAYQQAGVTSITPTEYAVRRISWTLGSTYAVTNTTCAAEVTTSGLGKFQGNLHNTSNSGGAINQYVWGNQTALAASGTIRGLCLSWKAAASAASSLFAVVAVTSFTLAINDKVNVEWAIYYTGT